MMLALFWLVFLVMWATGYRMASMHRLLLRHRRELVVRLGQVTVQLPLAERDASHEESAALLDRQLREMERLRFWNLFRMDA